MVDVAKFEVPEVFGGFVVVNLFFDGFLQFRPNDAFEVG
jgi:hypothetical protein